MELGGNAFNGLMALLLLVALDWGIWWNARFFLSIDYKHSDWTNIPRAFPTRRRFQTIKLLLGVSFVSSFVATMAAGAAQHLGLVSLSLTILVLFCVASAWESVKAFRYFATDNLNPRERGGYRER